MKKVFCILSILTVCSPVFAEITPSHTDSAPLAKDANNQTINPGYALRGAKAATDNNAASAGYVKGAYNATIKAINTVNSIKQDQINIPAATGAIVTNVTLNNDNKTIDVTRSYEVTMPVGSNNSSTRATVWFE